MKVFVGLSSGVDSAMASKILSDKRYDVTAVYMRLHDTKASLSNEKKARKIAEFLGIPFLVFDFVKEFNELIVKDFLDNYKRGKTPNPCVICNQKIKFGLFLKKSLSLGADYVATGHYVKKIGNSLYKALDEKKDQSYFLWLLSKKNIKKMIFPLASLKKEDIKKEIRKLKLNLAEDSQEVCFIENKTADFLKKHLKVKKGDIITDKGEKVGEHPGSIFYTIGQRKGLNLPGGPFFVFKKDSKKNIVYVSKDEKLLLKKELKFKKANWISEVSFPFKAKAKIRYQGKELDCLVCKNKAVFKTPQKAIAEGQSIVFYKGRKLLGGGVIYA